MFTCSDFAMARDLGCLCTASASREVLGEMSKLLLILYYDFREHIELHRVHLTSDILCNANNPPNSTAIVSSRATVSYKPPLAMSPVPLQ